MGTPAGLGAAEIAAIRKDAEAFLQETGRIHVYSSEASGGGGQREKFTAGPDLACRIAPYSTSRGSGSTGSAGDQVDEREKAFISLPFDTEVTTDDRVEVDGAGLYEVLSIAPRIFDRFLTRVEVKELP